MYSHHSRLHPVLVLCVSAGLLEWSDQTVVPPNILPTNNNDNYMKQQNSKTRKKTI